MNNRDLLNRIVDTAKKNESIQGLVCYGSYTRDDFDKYSDIEFYLFIEDGAFQGFDFNNWLSDIEKPVSIFVNGSGVTDVLFSDWLRGEFHIRPYSKHKELEGWIGVIDIGEIERTVLVDKKGEIKPIIEKVIELPIKFDFNSYLDGLVRAFADGIIFEWNVLMRRDLFRAYTLHFESTMRLARLLYMLKGETKHIYSPRLLEVILHEHEYSDLMNTLPQLDFESLRTSLEKTFKIFVAAGKENFSPEQRELLEYTNQRISERSYRIEVALIRGTESLFIKHKHTTPEIEYWLFPGGGRGNGENDESAAIRELQEETNVKVDEVSKFGEFKNPERDIYPSSKLFIGKYTGGKPIPGIEPEDPDNEMYVISEVRWFDLAKKESVDELLNSNEDYLKEKILELRKYILNGREKV